MTLPSNAYLLPSDAHFEYSCAIDSLKPLVKAAGMATMNSLPSGQLFSQIHNRLLLLTDIGIHLRTLEAERDSLVSSALAFDEKDRSVYQHYLDNYGHMPDFDRSAPLAIMPSLVRALRYSSISSLTDLRACHTLELQFVSDCFSQLDIYNTIDHRPIGSSGFASRHGTSDVLKVWRKYIAESPAKLIRDVYLYPKEPSCKDEVTELLESMTLNARRSFTIQRIMQAMTTAHDAGWFVVFDTLTLSDDKIKEFYDTPTALRDHFREIGRLVLAAENRPVKQSSSDCFQYFAVPEYGSKEGRLHFHAVYLMRTLPSGSTDPNFGRRVRNRRQLDSLRGVWQFGYSLPIAVRYTGDAYSASGWLWPVDSCGRPIESKPLIAVARYVGKYVNKKTSTDKILKATGEREKWNETLRNHIMSLPKTAFRVRMSRGFGMTVLPMTSLKLNTLLELTKLGRDSTRCPQVIRQNAKRELRSRLASMPVYALQDARPPVINLLKSLRDSMRQSDTFSPQSFILSLTLKLSITDISDEARQYIQAAGLVPLPISKRPTVSFGSK